MSSFASVNAHDARLNHLISALPDDAARRLLTQLEPVELRLRQVLCESGRTLTHVYFPTTAIVSLLYVTEQGSSAEIAVVRASTRRAAQPR